MYAGTMQCRSERCFKRVGGSQAVNDNLRGLLPVFVDYDAGTVSETFDARREGTQSQDHSKAARSTSLMSLDRPALATTPSLSPRTCN